MGGTLRATKAGSAESLNILKGLVDIKRISNLVLNSQGVNLAVQREKDGGSAINIICRIECGCLKALSALLTDG